MGLIDKDATLKAIADYLRADLADCNHHYLQGAQDVAEVVENMPERGRWIPCKERLPKGDRCFYLVTIANYGLNFTTTLPDDVDVVRWDYDRRKGQNSWHWYTERTVTAWQPLPEPYKEAKK